MALKFCANLNYLFSENSTQILERFRLAKLAGFRAVENGFPIDVSVDDAVRVQKETGLEVVLLNICLGQVQGGEFGCTSIPDKEKEFKSNLHRTVEFAKALNCKKIHLLAGKLQQPPTKDHHLTYLKNLKYAASVLASENITGLIEPICKYGVPGYYLNNYEDAVEILEKVNSSHIKLMVDLYHLQHIKGNITNTIRDLLPLIGHIQIAQVPGRNEPNTLGEINYEFVFKVIKEAGYDDWIGCEYKPINGTNLGLNWVKEFGYSL
ncbi:putative hydroxypyruvate isomerase [Pseudolycoriella hygida]|uniref:Putative hydroxypyruvate isomerase n=1 Tax=Pseudolycoriella hygida TaxID=35572 RepID=A0A9Q0RYQ0_9DIPT|nr:putative hydroxypyruvate isomerase [Pseudolycoriella hygida]